MGGSEIIMGFKSWIIKALGGTVEEEKTEADKEVKGYELYDLPAGGKWVKILDLTEPVDFEELEDALPGHTYKLQVRYTSGLVRQIWYRHLAGDAVERVIDPIDQMERALAPMTKFGERISTLQENIRGAFGWAFPQQPPGGGGSGAPGYTGTLPAYLHPLVPQGLQAWSPVFKEWTKAITSGVREGAMSESEEERKDVEAAVEFKKPSPRPEDYLIEEEPEKEAE